ncbi:MAG: type II toxin-antitoxin system VapC family toxin [Planctomycetes bacterium]|nr:type II toxin-antitoxin system VapC family toxin [Planctomycetota bacterium]
MTPLVFVDSSALVAWVVEKDQDHKAAVACMVQLLAAHSRLLTTECVFDESVTLVRKFGGYLQAVMLGEALRDGTPVRMIEISNLCREKAWAEFRRYREPLLSFTDCTSLVTIRDCGARIVFSFDSDFQKLGIQTIPGRHEKP